MTARAKLFSGLVITIALHLIVTAHAQTCPAGVDATASRALQAVTLPPAAPNKCAVQMDGGFPMPDPKCTPGAYNPTVTIQTLHNSHFDGTCTMNRALSNAQRAQVYSWYGIEPPRNNTGKTQTCALDYLIPLELGGADELENIWPLCGPNNVSLSRRFFRQKRAVAQYLLKKVKSDDMTLAEGQAGITDDWTQYIDQAVPASQQTVRHRHVWRYHRRAVVRVMEKKPTVLRLLLASTRKLGRTEDPNNSLELISSDEPTVPSVLTFGAALVSVPPTHKAGNVERPFCLCLFGMDLYRETENQNNHFVLKSTVWLSEDDFTAAVNNNNNHQALVFVHGFNTSLADGLYRLAQIVFDSHFEGAPILFSWPSTGAIKDYVHDAEAQQDSWDGFRQLIKLLQADPQIAVIHVIGHSMGNRVILGALEDHPLEKKSLGELIMAAPDVDRDQFMIEEPKVTGFRGVTLYASSKDWALKASEQLARDFARAGDVPPPPLGPLVLPGMDTIDASALGTDLLGLNHDTFAASSALCDIGRLINSGIEPPQSRTPVLRTIAGPPAFWRYDRQDPNWDSQQGCTK